MNLINELKTYFSKNSGLDPYFIDYLSEKEKSAWMSSNYQAGGSDTQRAFDSRLGKKIQLIGLFSLYGKSSGLRKQLISITVEYAFIRVLVLLNAVRLYTLLAERLLPKCLTFHMLHEGQYLSYLLSRRYYMLRPMKYKMEKVSRLKLLFNTELSLEWEAQEMYGVLAYSLAKSKNLSKEDTLFLNQSMSRLNDMSSKLANPRFIFYKYSMLILNSELANDFNNVIQLCDNALFQLQGGAYTNPSSIRAFINKKVNAYTQLKQYDKAESILGGYHNQFIDNKYNHLRYNEQLLILLLKQMKIDDAYIILKVIMNMDYKQFGELITERIYLYKMYIGLFKKPHGDLNRQIPNLQSMQSDSKGMNIAIEAAHLVQAALGSDFEYISSQSSRVDKYLSVHARTNGRTKLFIRLIINLPLAKADWHKWKNINNRLHARMLKSTDSVEELEIVDYNILWPFICEQALENMPRFKNFKILPTSERLYTINGKPGTGLHSSIIGHDNT